MFRFAIPASTAGLGLAAIQSASAVAASYSLLRVGHAFLRTTEQGGLSDDGTVFSFTP